MIQDIAPHKLDMTYSLTSPSDEEYAVVVQGSKILLQGAEAHQTLPRVGELAAAFPALRSSLVRLFAIDGGGIYVFTGDAPEEIPGFSFADTFILRTFQPSWLGFAAVTAHHLGTWYAANRFCGGCGARMQAKADERAVVCPECGSVVYPRISPAVIVGVVDGDRLLMTRYANRPNNTALTALVAGFMEIGETLEDTVAREVEEEVGVRVKNIRYYKSQPWAFSGSVLVGFFADVDGPTAIRLDENELQEAKWIARGDIADNLPLMSLTATMVDAFRRNDFPA